MGIIYVNEDGAVIGCEGSRVTIKKGGEILNEVPIESLDCICILGKSQITTQGIEACLKRGIDVQFFSRGGSYFGRLQSMNHTNVFRQRKQAELYDSEFSKELARKIILSKIQNQKVVLNRYARSKKLEIRNINRMMTICKNKVKTCEEIAEMIGYEGQAAKYYFQGLAKCVPDEFKFSGRNRRPPKDEFNSLISFGYSILLNELYSKLESKGLNPYFGFIHRDAEKHPALASDMMEEWRAVIVDATVLSLLNGHEIKKEDFWFDDETGGCYLKKDGLVKFIDKLEKKLQTDIRYLSYVDYAVNFRKAIYLQINELVKSMEMEDPQKYEPIVIR